ncbi:MAG: MFS transporter [Bulleidia sp.]
MNESQRNRRNLIAFPIGSIGRDMAYVLFTGLILTYVLFTRQLTAVQLTAITVIMVAARVFDPLNDPVMGNIVECTNTRFGKFRPCLVIGILATSAVLIVTFNTALQEWSFIALFGVMYFLYSIACTMHDSSCWGMIASLSSDADMRSRITSRATLSAGIGSTLASMFTTGAMTLGGSTDKAYGIVAPLLMAGFIPLMK